MASHLDDKDSLKYLFEELPSTERDGRKDLRRPWAKIAAVFLVAGIINFAILTTKFPSWTATNPLDDIRSSFNLPSLAIGALRGGKLDMDAVGVRKRWSTPAITVEDNFHLGSCTKAMTATLGAMIMKPFFYTFDTTLAEIFPKANISAGNRHTTLAMLTAHRSGITDEWIGKDLALTAEFYAQRQPPKETRQLIAETLLSRPPNAPAGKEFIYSNTGYMIFGYILEYLTGIPWEELMLAAIFTPLGMSNCGFGVPPESSRFAIDNPWPHRQSPFGPVPVPPASGDNPPAIGPAGTVHCPMSDYAKFLQQHLDGYNGKPTKLRILTTRDYARLHTPYPGPGPQYTSGGWNRGWDERAGTFLKHEGSNTMFYLTAYLTPDVNGAYVAMTNVGHSEAQDALWEAINGMIDGELLGHDSLDGSL